VKRVDNRIGQVTLLDMGKIFSLCNNANCICNIAKVQMSSRILDVLEAVAMFGPASLDEISEKLPRTRSSVYRALKALEVDGWIRRSLNGRSFLISCRMERLVDYQSNMPDDIAEVTDIFRNKLKNQRLLLTIALHIKGNHFAIMDSNSFPIPVALECPYRRDMLSDLVTVISVNKIGTLQKKSTWLNENSKFREISKRIREEGYIISNDLEMGFLPVLIGSGDLIVVMLENKHQSNVSLARIKSTMEDFAECLKKSNVAIYRSDESSRLLAG